MALPDGKWCARHAVTGPQREEAYRKAAMKKVDAKRGSAGSRGYGRKWRKLRARFLTKNPDCVSCGRVATVVDHILPLNDGGGNEMGNLQALCRDCHAKKTGKDVSARRRG
ncbi:MAG: hypothetical protein Alpg2KO_00410 [Alphaproteobacteria bacterium]